MSIAMPRVRQTPTPNYSATPIAHDLVVLHMMEGGYAGSVAWLCDPRAKASAHLCMSEDGEEATQLVPLSMKAWAQCAFNGRGVSVEMPGFTAQGVPDARLRALAKIAAWLCRAYAIPPVWAKGGRGRGVCSHHDLGAAGGGHVDICGVGDATWAKVMGFIGEAYAAFGEEPLPVFALHGLPNPLEAAPSPPLVAPAPSHAGAMRHEAGDGEAHATASGFPHGSTADLQWKLNAAGAAPALALDGFFGPITKRALAAFQDARGLAGDGLVGPSTWAALAA